MSDTTPPGFVAYVAYVVALRPQMAPHAGARFATLGEDEQRAWAAAAAAVLAQGLSQEDV
jgi:hypothetical protein